MFTLNNYSVLIAIPVLKSSNQHLIHAGVAASFALVDMSLQPEKEFCPLIRPCFKIIVINDVHDQSIMNEVQCRCVMFFVSEDLLGFYFYLPAKQDDQIIDPDLLEKYLKTQEEIDMRHRRGMNDFTHF